MSSDPCKEEAKMKRTILLVVAIIIAVATNLPATTPASPSAPSAGLAQEYIQKASNPPGFEQPQGTTTSTAPVGRAGEDVLSEDWLEPHNAAANACANSGDPHDVLKEKLMIEHGLIVPLAQESSFRHVCVARLRRTSETNRHPD